MDEAIITGIIRRKIGFFFCLLCALCSHSQYIERIEGSPYPASRKPDTLYIIDDTRLSPAQQLIVQSMQGLLAMYKPEIYRIRYEGSLMWLSEMHSRYGVYMNYDYVNDYVGLVRHFQDSIDGYILCKMTDGNANAAISLASVFNAITIPDSFEKDFSFLKKVMDVRGWDVEDVYAKFHDSLSRTVLTYQKDSMANWLGDYSIFSNSYQFYEPVSSRFTQAVFKDMLPDCAVMGWGGDEHELVQLASKNSLMVNPSDYANNLSTLTNFNVAGNYDQADSPVSPDTTDPNVHTVCFVMTDGDNIQWFLHSFATSKQWFNSDDRGSIPLGWTISPALAELAPPIMKYLYDNASNGQGGRDYFVAAPSGLGYLFPDASPQLVTYAELLNKFLIKTDMRIVNVIGNSRNVDLSAYTQMSNLDGIFYYMYSDYAGWKGKIIWSNDKPIIGARYAMWGDRGPQAIAEALNGEVKNQFQPEGYSLVPVHAWTHSVEDVKKCIGMLDGNVRVVAPDDFVRLIRRNLGVFLYQNYPNPFIDKTTISFKVTYSQNVTLQILDGSGTVIQTIYDGVANPGVTRVEFHRTEAMLNGPYVCTLVTQFQTKTVQIDAY